MKKSIINRRIFSWGFFLPVALGCHTAHKPDAASPVQEVPPIFQDIKSKPDMTKENSTPVTTKVWFFNNRDETITVPIIYQDGSSEETTVSPNGIFKANAAKGNFAFFKEGPKTKRFYLTFDDTEGPEGCWERLVNLNYLFNEKVVSKGCCDNDNFRSALQDFQMHIGIESTAKCDETTRQALDAVLKSEATRYELLIDRVLPALAQRTPSDDNGEFPVRSIREILAEFGKGETDTTFEIFNTKVHLPAFMQGAEETSRGTVIHPMIREFFRPILPMRSAVVFLAEHDVEPKSLEGHSFRLSIFKAQKPYTHENHIRNVKIRLQGNFAEEIDGICFYRLFSDGVVFYWIVYRDTFIELSYRYGVSEVMISSEDAYDESIGVDPVFANLKPWILNTIRGL